MKCSKCGTETTALSGYNCMNCGKRTCLEHRMPERHDCYRGDPLKGIEVRSLFDSGAEKPSQPAPRPAAAGDARKFERMQPEPEKKKRFGMF
jgi:DNA-directed RNA polymerase subunit RPC12/RpoP